MDRNLVQRISVAAVGIPAALGLVWWGGWPLAIMLALIAGQGANEVAGLAAQQGTRILRRTGCFLAALVPLLVEFRHAPFAGTEVLRGTDAHLVALAFLGILTTALVRRAPNDRPLATAAVTVLAVLYTGFLPSFLLVIRHAAPERSWQGTWLVFFPLVVTWVCDTAAMFGGRAFGAAKLAPSISPGKTRAGGIAGVVGGMVTALLFALVVFPAIGVAINPLPALVIGLVLSVVGQVGDLAESLFKREAGVKDSSALIPGHGGVLDRFDSLYFVLPLAATLYALLGVV